MAKDIVKVDSSLLSESIDSFNSPLADFLRSTGLPVDDILAPIDERKKVITQFQTALQPLETDDRAKANYLTKFAVAVTVGLFDGALNYLWNETIAALRYHVCSFDLEYFFSVVEQVSSRNRNLNSEEDLSLISDHDLLDACRRIGLLTDVDYRRLEHVNYMRNHASAAHPTQVGIDGYELLSWLTNCLKIAIAATPNHAIINLKQLLSNIRQQTIPAVDFPHIGAEIGKMPSERIDDLLSTLFGMYVSPQAQANVKANIDGLAKFVWDAASHERKLETGSKYGVYRKNADVQRKDSAQTFLENVKGLSYRDDDSLAGELIEKLEDLRRAHFSINNFYNEYPYAKSLKLSLPTTGKVPPAARQKWVKVLCICYVGNGLGYREGVDESALPHYRDHIQNFSDDDISVAVSLMDDPEFSAIFERNKKTNERGRKLFATLRKKAQNIHIQRALEYILNFTADLDKIGDDTKFKQIAAQIPKT